MEPSNTNTTPANIEEQQPSVNPSPVVVISTIKGSGDPKRLIALVIGVLGLIALSVCIILLILNQTKVDKDSNIDSNLVLDNTITPTTVAEETATPTVSITAPITTTIVTPTNTAAQPLITIAPTQGQTNTQGIINLRSTNTNESINVYYIKQDGLVVASKTNTAYPQITFTKSNTTLTFTWNSGPLVLVDTSVALQGLTLMTEKQGSLIVPVDQGYFFNVDSDVQRVTVTGDANQTQHYANNINYQARGMGSIEPPCGNPYLYLDSVQNYFDAICTGGDTSFCDNLIVGMSVKKI